MGFFSSRAARLGAVSVATGALVALGGAAAPAGASPVPVPIGGNVAFTIGAKTVNQLVANCGGLPAMSARSAIAKVAWVPVAGGMSLRITVPISGVEVEPGSGAIRVDTAGTVVLDDDCYTISMGTIRIDNYGQDGETSSFDVSAVSKSVDDGGRMVWFTLGFDDAVVSVTQHGAIRINKISMHASSDGAQELNELGGFCAPGADPCTGAFSAGDQVGNAKATVKLSSS